MRLSLTVVGCGVAFGVALIAGPSGAQDTTPDQSHQGRQEPIVGPDKARRSLQATALSVEADCSPIYAGERTAVFSWEPARRGDRARLDITQFYDGWDTGRFETVAVLPRTADSYQWDGGEPAAEYLWRILTFGEGSWHASEASRYAVPVCVGDEEEPDGEDPDEPEPQ
jgi:hypothetical protein